MIDMVRREVEISLVKRLKMVSLTEKLYKSFLGPKI